MVALTIGPNADSQGLMKRLGMIRREDLDFYDPRQKPEMNPTIVYSIDAADWPAAITTSRGMVSTKKGAP